MWLKQVFTFSGPRPAVRRDQTPVTGQRCRQRALMVAAVVMATLWGGTAAADSGFLGIQVQPVDPSIRQALSLTAAGGVIVRDVEGGGPAWRGGLRTGDVVLGFDGRAVTGFDDLVTRVGTTKAGQTVSFRIWRSAAEQPVAVTMGGWPAGWKISTVATAVLPEFGLTVIALSEKNRLDYGIRWGSIGVIVRQVTPGSPAAQAGLKGGDVIVAAGRAVVTAPDTLEAALKAMGPRWYVLAERGNAVFLAGDGAAGQAVVAGETVLAARLADGPYVMDTARNPQWLSPASALTEMPVPYQPPPEAREGAHEVGATLASLSADRRKRYNLRWSSRGVVVDGVDAGGRAQLAGLKAGDVIAQVNQQPVSDVGQAKTLLAGAGPLLLTVERADGFQFIVLGVTTASTEGETRPGPVAPLLKWQADG